jgi:hypothetical protein
MQWANGNGVTRSFPGARSQCDRHSNARVFGLGRSRVLVLGKSFGRAKAIGGDREGFGDATEDCGCR